MAIDSKTIGIADNEAAAVIAALISRARAAMSTYENNDQQRIDDAVTAVAWAAYKPERARKLANKAVSDTGLGKVESKLLKNTRKTFGTLRDLLRVRTTGVIEEDTGNGLVKYAKPVGVVAAVCPSTNPAATPVNKAMMALKGGNAVIIAPSPAGYSTTELTVNYMRQALARTGHPRNLVQILPAPVSRLLTQSLMEQSDLVVCTGSQNNVRRAYSSGTVAIGVGAGNVPVIVDSTADLDDAALKICESKTFDNATSCSSENSLIILDDIYEEAIAALKKVGAYRASADEKQLLKEKLRVNGNLNRQLIAKDADVFAAAVGLQKNAAKATMFLVEEDFDPTSPFADEKLSLVLTVYRAQNFDHAVELINNVLDVRGKGHSCGIHTGIAAHAERLAEEIDTVRVLVNQAHTFGNGGSFKNALPFTLSMGCGTWAGNSISENLNYRNFINITHLVREVEEDKPTEEELFGAYFEKYGKE